MPIIADRDEMIQQNMGLVHACAHKFKGRGIEYEDLFQAGCMGLIKATDAFDESQEAGFEARYKWYKAAIDGAYDTYGMKFTHISADANEADVIDTDWIIYFADRLKN